MDEIVIAAAFALVALGCADAEQRAQLAEEADETRIDARFDPVEDVAPAERERIEAQREAREATEARILADREAMTNGEEGRR